MSGYTALPTKNPGDVLTSALWNTFLQGNADSGFMRMLADSTLGAPAASFDFASIPQTFAHLMVVLSVQGSNASADVNVGCRMNGNTGNNYYWTELLQNNTTLGGSNQSTDTSGRVGGMMGSTAGDVTVRSPIIIYLPQYTATRKQSWTAQCAYYNGTALQSRLNGGFFNLSTAITQLTLLPLAGNFIAGSRATLYGIPA